MLVIFAVLPSFLPHFLPGMLFSLTESPSLFPPLKKEIRQGNNNGELFTVGYYFTGLRNYKKRFLMESLVYVNNFILVIYYP